jgi:hypothetical protein
MEKIGPLRQLAAQQGIHQIGRLEDAAPLLFGPKVHKSYPLSLLEGNHFDKLTRWLGRLTTHDLSRIDVSGCDTIDGWLDRLEAQTPMLVMHSSGTSGKLSIIPRSHTETCHHVEMWFKFMDGYRREYGGDIRALNGTLPIFLPTYRQGRHVQRAMEIAYPAICGSDEHFICAFPGKLSADLLTLGGRLAAAEARGEQGRLTLNPALLEQRERILEFQRRVPEFMDAFFGKMLEYRGRRVMFVGTWVSLLQATLAGEKRGIQGLFAADSFSITGGGKKGQVFPDDWYERICRFYGVPQMRASYGMTEMIGLMQECREHNHPASPGRHLLDPDRWLLPRGCAAGRFGYMDRRRGRTGRGVGDAVTVHWGRPARAAGGRSSQGRAREAGRRRQDHLCGCASGARRGARIPGASIDRITSIRTSGCRGTSQRQPALRELPARVDRLGIDDGPQAMHRCHGDHPELFPPNSGRAPRPREDRPHQRHSAPMNNEGDTRGQARSPSIFRSDRASRR